MIKIFSNVSKFLIPLLVITNISLLVQINLLPNKISKAINNKSTTNINPDTIIIEKQKTLKSRTDFFYAKGEVISKSTKLLNAYNYEPNYPEEIWEGFITRFKTDDNQLYYIWTNNPIEKNQMITGWFLTDNISLFGINSNKQYIQIIYPIVRSKIGENKKTK